MEFNKIKRLNRRGNYLDRSKIKYFLAGSGV